MIYRALLASILAGAAMPRDLPTLRSSGDDRLSLVVREVLPQAAVGGPTIVIASTDQSDRMDDIVDQATWKLDEFRANPVILWAHDNHEFPVGKCVEVAVVEGKLRMAIEWDESTENGATCARQFKEGFLSAVSVGFRPGRVVGRSQLPKEDARYKENSYGVVFYDCQLLECSAVPVPANPGALVTQRSARDVEADSVITRAIEMEQEMEILRRGHAELTAIVRGLPGLLREAAREAVAGEFAAIRAIVEEAQADSVAAIRQHLDETAERTAAGEEWDWSDTETKADPVADAWGDWG